MAHLALNEDSTHFYTLHPDDDMTAEGLDAWVDQYADTQVRELMLCPNAQRSSVASQARQSVWDGFDPEQDINQPFFAGIRDKPWLYEWGAREHVRRRVSHALRLHKQGLDPYARWIARCRVHSISPWISMRMNDAHWTDQPKHPIHDRFWVEHPEYRREPESSGPIAQSLDYGRPEVRTYQMAYVRELISRYEMDGFELDWMRFGYYFRPGEEEAGCAVLTDFVAEVRHLLDTRTKELGRPIRLGVRVPSRPDTARKMGMDVAAWAGRGLIDTLVATPFLRLEFDMPIEAWRDLLDGTGVTLAAGLMSSVKVGRLKPYRVTLETIRGAASNLLHRGVDRIDIFNLMDYLPTDGMRTAYNRMLREIGSLDTMAGKPRRHVLTSPDFQSDATLVPCDIAEDQRAEFNISIGPTTTEGQVVRVMPAMENPELLEQKKMTLRVNGSVCSFVDPVGYPCETRPAVYMFEAPAGVVHGGCNTIELHNNSTRTIRLTWLEMAISDNSGQWPASGIDAQPLHTV